MRSKQSSVEPEETWGFIRGGKNGFFDEFGTVYHDPDHSVEEERYLLLGNSYKLNTVIVCHCFREGESKIRIISARKANRSEQAEYWNNRK